MNNRITTFVISVLLLFMGSIVAFAGEDALFASSSVSIYKNSKGKTSIGELAVGSKVVPIKKVGDMIQIEVFGWRQQGLNSVIYAFEGKRIIVAELEPAGVKLIKVLKTVKDEDTQQIWQKVVLKDVWVKSKYFVNNVNEVWDKIAPLFHHRCSMCHALPRTTTFTANQWPATLRVMTKRAALNRQQTEEVTHFLQYHAKDTINLKR